MFQSPPTRYPAIKCGWLENPLKIGAFDVNIATFDSRRAWQND